MLTSLFTIFFQNRCLDYVPPRLTSARIVTGRLIYHGAREEILPFFARMGFTLPARVAIADFLQEVTSKSDQGIYWSSRPEEVIPHSARNTGRQAADS